MRAYDFEVPGPRPKCLLVLLPGGGDDAETFVHKAIVQEIGRRGLSIDMVGVDASIGYYTRGVLTKRLADDVVLRRMRRGYKELWLLGNSLGGFGALLYASQRPPGEVTGLLALSPFLGTDTKLFNEITAQGLDHWHAPPKPAQLNEHNYVPELWRWLQAVTSHRELGPQLYLGYGRSESLARPDSLLAAALPRDHVYLTHGRHGWHTWQRLIDQFLNDGPLEQHCGPAPVEPTRFRTPRLP